MFSSELTEMASLVIASKGWVWEEGLLIRKGETQKRLGPNFLPYKLESEGWLPVLTDPATSGIIQRRVMSLYGKRCGCVLEIRCGTGLKMGGRTTGYWVVKDEYGRKRGGGTFEHHQNMPGEVKVALAMVYALLDERAYNTLEEETDY